MKKMKTINQGLIRSLPATDHIYKGESYHIFNIYWGGSSKWAGVVDFQF